MKLRTWSSKEIKPGTRVLLRLELNVPVVKGKVLDGGKFGRIAQALPEIERLRTHGASIIIASHLGKPDGKVQKKFSLRPVAKVLGKRLRTTIPVISMNKLPKLKAGQIVMLENLRFDKGEETNDAKFALRLAKLADVYVNNAFGVCHRKHASVHAVTKYLPSFAGELLRTEVTQLSQPPSKPLVLIMGGAKIKTKLGIMNKLGPKANKILIGGGLAVTCLKAAGVDLPVYPPALTKPTDVTMAKKLLKKFKGRIVLPHDLKADIPKGIDYDLGPATQAKYVKTLAGAKTIIWNGPLGIIEDKQGQQATRVLALAVGASKARSVIGGGETVEFLERRGLLRGFDHVSTGGGAMLAFLSGEKLPGLERLYVR